MIVYFGNTLNRHQSNVADALYDLTNGNYIYVETVKPREDNSWGGKLKIERPYVLTAYQDVNLRNEAMRLARESDVALFGANSLDFEIARMSLDDSRLAFEVSERWLKRGMINLLSPRLLKNLWYYHSKGWGKKPLYKLCSSAYCAGDQYLLQSFKDRCYKWGYFTDVEELCIETLQKADDPIVKILWCARFLKLKHPELVVRLAHRLMKSGYKIQIDMYGSGAELERTKYLCRKLNVENIICFQGKVSNKEVIEAMRQHDIFLFTSDRNEGWGAVLNEAMSSGCAVVASDAIGSVPFLIEDGVNGMVFRSGSLGSLYNKVKYLLDKPVERKAMAEHAYYTMKNVWSPRKAAENFLHLVDDLHYGRETSILEGPCSKAVPIKNKTVIWK